VSTYLQLINRVLVALSDGNDLVDTGATSISDVAHLKIAQFVNDVLEEVEDAGQWRVLRQRLTATISASQVSGSITSAVPRSNVFRVHDRALDETVPLVFDATTSTAKVRLREIDLAALLYLDQQNSGQTNGNNGPQYFAISPTAAGCDVYVWPRSSGERTIELDMTVPQARLDPTDSTDLGTTIKVPDTIVQLGAYEWASSERGEELGTRGDKAERRYLKKLADAIAVEHSIQGLDDLVPV
jgi:hypothetical protein